MVIRLEEAQREIALFYAEKRFYESARLGCKDKFGCKDPDNKLGRAGACGELAVAVFLGLPLKLTVNTFKSEPDFTYRSWPIEVRTSIKPGTPLFVRDGDKDQAVFIHLTELEHTWEYRINGWRKGWEVRRYGEKTGDPRRPLMPAMPIEDLISAYFLRFIPEMLPDLKREELFR